jgi:hypothetical protein
MEFSLQTIREQLSPCGKIWRLTLQHANDIFDHAIHGRLTPPRAAADVRSEYRIRGGK